MTALLRFLSDVPDDLNAAFLAFQDALVRLRQSSAISKPQDIIRVDFGRLSYSSRLVVNTTAVNAYRMNDGEREGLKAWLLRVDRGDAIDVLLAPLRSVLELRDQPHASFRLLLS